MTDDMNGAQGQPATKGDLGTLREEIRAMLRPVVVTLAHHTAELADIRGYIDDHERRIAALESKNS